LSVGIPRKSSGEEGANYLPPTDTESCSSVELLLTVTVHYGFASRESTSIDTFLLSKGDLD